MEFRFFDVKKDTAFLDRLAFQEIFAASALAILLSILWLYVTRFKLITRFFQWIGATKRYGDEDVWDYTFNSSRAEVEYVHLRDFEKRITYAGWVQLFSETEKVRELVLRDVVVYDFDGNQLFETPRVYIARSMDNIDIEFPYRGEPRGE